ncbi:hypothetical protein NML43_13375 [Rhodopseudomonas palustris]|jgi:hypothetical protein|uniref:hypothetical protein n=1 Tax=Rhodopseudomonas TaxID=1073 RepID=UPI0006B8EA99|nr:MULTISPECIES: hypothetical protein [Rhodopseudomonas]KPF94249.1 hypothetical protein IP86_22715 [Rhodopseudomonas sp. AAP120]MCP9628078.1 hypothetical protein [Rhodopseudomonas palustris]
MSKPDDKTSDTINYLDRTDAPHVYFDIAPAHGVMANNVEIELAARTLNPLPDGSVEVKFVTTARLRCSQAGALHLRNALDAVLKMFEASQQSPAAAGKLN